MASQRPPELQKAYKVAGSNLAQDNVIQDPESPKTLPNVRRMYLRTRVRRRLFFNYDPVEHVNHGWIGWEVLTPDRYYSSRTAPEPVPTEV